MSDIRCCIVCNTPSELRCPRCQGSYCSRQCQQEDWSMHRLACFPKPNLLKSKQPQLEAPIKEENEIDVPLRAPKSKLPTLPQCATTSSTSRKFSSLFMNPFKRNSENIAFNTNDTKCIKLEASDIKSEPNGSVAETSSPDRNSAGI